MATKAKREIRFTHLNMFYQQYENRMFIPGESLERNLEVAQMNVEQTGHFLYESELEAFTKKYPDVNMDEFTAFLKTTNALKEKKASGGGGVGQTRLESAEKMAELGVAPEHQADYQTAIGNIRQLCTFLANICPNGRPSFALPLKKKKVEEAEPVVAEATDAQADAPE